MGFSDGRKMSEVPEEAGRKASGASARKALKPTSWAKRRRLNEETL
jgi:hypothetical protein